MSIVKIALLGAAIVTVPVAPVAARADEPLRDVQNEALEILPGASREISHAMSASRDTALMGWALTPYSVLTAGADVGILKLNESPVAIRLGFFGMLELESDRPFAGNPQGDFIPRENSAYWRAVGGYSGAVAFERFAKRHLGQRGAFEMTLSLRHESEHFTGSTSGDPPRFQEYPHIGNLILYDIAVRVPMGRFDFELRLQSKVFLGQRNYVVGPGGDVIVRWHLSKWLEPFSSTFAEYLVGKVNTFDDGRTGRVPDDSMVRNLTGFIFPGRVGDIQIFNAIEVGNGKGLNVYKRELRWGGGIRLAFF